MLNKIFRAASLFVVSIALSSSVLFAGWTTAEASTPGFTPPGDYRKEDSLGIGPDSFEDSEEKEVPKDEMSMEEIFGSEQVFPFEMGLGNSAF